MQGPYESEWWAHGIKYQRDLMILTLQFKKQIVFSAGPFTNLTVATFLSVSSKSDLVLDMVLYLDLV